MQGAKQSSLRRALDGLYLAGGVLAGVFLISIACLVLLSIVSRLLGIFVPGLSEYAGYAMASSSFLALAYTFGKGGHIRVSLVVNRFSGRARIFAELWCLTVGSFLACYLAWYSVKMVRVSHMLGDISEGSDAIPLWIPQIGMAAGAVLLAIALVDRLISVALGAPLIAEKVSE